MNTPCHSQSHHTNGRQGEHLSGERWEDTGDFTRRGRETLTGGNTLHQVAGPGDSDRWEHPTSSDGARLFLNSQRLALPSGLTLVTEQHRRTNEDRYRKRKAKPGTGLPLAKMPSSYVTQRSKSK